MVYIGSTCQLTNAHCDHVSWLLFAVDSGEPLGATAAVRGPTALSAGTFGRCLQRRDIRIWWRGRLLGGHRDSAVGVPYQGRTPAPPGHSTVVGYLPPLLSYVYRGADKSLARPRKKQATVTEDFELHISYL
jgi:hypothetical protein